MMYALGDRKEKKGDRSNESDPPADCEGSPLRGSAMPTIALRYGLFASLRPKGDGGRGRTPVRPNNDTLIFGDCPGNSAGRANDRI